MSKQIEVDVAARLEAWRVPFAARYVGEQTQREAQRVDAWRVTIGTFETDYYTGHNLVAVSMPGAPRFERAVIILTDADSIEGVPA
jgi:hypothetical protein